MSRKSGEVKQLNKKGGVKFITMTITAGWYHISKASLVRSAEFLTTVRVDQCITEYELGE